MNPNPKIAKLDEEYEKNAARIAQLQARQREVDKQRTQLRNNDILELVQEHSLDFNALAKLLDTLKHNPAAAMSGEMDGNYYEEG